MHLISVKVISIDPITEQLAFSVSEHLAWRWLTWACKRSFAHKHWAIHWQELSQPSLLRAEIEEHSMNSATSEQPLSLLMLDLITSNASMTTLVMMQVISCWKRSVRYLNRVSVKMWDCLSLRWWRVGGAASTLHYAASDRVRTNSVWCSLFYAPRTQRTFF